jgi:antitoxin (DNA-binding transcriptional repressor) of toxin-antitoxin stability system
MWRHLADRGNPRGCATPTALLRDAGNGALQVAPGHGSVVTCDHMRPRIGIRELRDTLTATIRRVRNGETLEVTHDGVPVAVLAPLRNDRIQQLVAGGDVTSPTPLERPIRRFRVTGELTATEAIEDDRAER